MRLVKGTAFLLCALLLAGCAQKVQISALEPAPVDRAATVESLAVLPFESDRVGLGAKITALAASYELFEGQPYFRVIEREGLERILDEQRLGQGGLVDASQAVQIGRLSGAQALIMGRVMTASVEDTPYQKSERECIAWEDNKCVRHRDIRISCISRQAILSAQVRMVSVKDGELITAQNFQENASWSRCSDDSTDHFPARAQALDQLSDRIARGFIASITPRYVTFEVKLIDKSDLKLPKEQTDRFKSALAFIQEGRFDRGAEILADLHFRTQEQSYAIAYNLGITHEAQGRYDQARELYHLADRRTDKPVDEINQALLRIDRLITQHERAQSQIERSQ